MKLLGRLGFSTTEQDEKLSQLSSLHEVGRYGDKRGDGEWLTWREERKDPRYSGEIALFYRRELELRLWSREYWFWGGGILLNSFAGIWNTEYGSWVLGSGFLSGGEPFFFPQLAHEMTGRRRPVHVSYYCK